MGMRIIARDSMGRVAALMCSTLPYIRDPTVAEVIGAKRAVEFGRERGFLSIELEGDAREVVLALGSSEECCDAYENIIRETQLLLATSPCWRVGMVLLTCWQSLLHPIIVNIFGLVCVLMLLRMLYVPNKFLNGQLNFPFKKNNNELRFLKESPY
jgi:hypothetical protein